MIQKLLISIFLLLNLLHANGLPLLRGWQLLGGENNYTDMQAFNQPCISSVWTYDTTTNSWSAYSPDSVLQQKISNTNIPTLTNIDAYKGFWVDANDICRISTTPITYSTDSLWNSAQEFSLDMVADKSFNFIYPTLFHNFEDITFDQTGKTIIQHFYPSELLSIGALPTAGDLSDGTNMNFNNGLLAIYWDKTYGKGNSELKIVSQSEIGYIAVNRFLPNYLDSFQEQIVAFISSNAIENPIDMNTKLPYTTYNSPSAYLDKKSVVYNDNGSIETYKNGVLQSPTDVFGNSLTGPTSFTVENGKIVTYENYETPYYTSNTKHQIQIVFSINDYDILKDENIQTYQDKAVTLYNSDLSDYTIFDINSSIVTFYDLFDVTDNRLGDVTFNLETHQATNLYVQHTFSLSNDAKTMTLCTSDSLCETMSLKNGYLYENINYDVYSIVKTTPF